LLLCIVVLGAGLRFVGIGWGEGQAIHPDEEFLRQVTAAVAWPDQAGLYFDTAASPLNPYNRGHGFFVYGTLPLFLTRGVGEALDAGCEAPHSLVTRLLAPVVLGRSAEECWPGSFTTSRVTGRMLAALFDLGTLVFVFLAARRLRSFWTGALAALLYALAVLPIQQSHFYTVDAFAGFFAAGVVYFVLLAVQTGDGASFLLAGLMTGLGVACKISVWPLGLLVALAGGLRLVIVTREARQDDAALADEDEAVPAADEAPLEPEVPASRQIDYRPMIWAVLAGVVALVAFRIAQPYVFMGPGFFGLRLNDQWLGNMAEIRGQMSGRADVYHGFQWAARPPLVFPWINMVFWGLGLPLGLAAWAAWGGMGLQILRHRKDLRRVAPLVLVWVWATLYFLYQGTQWVKSIRYFIPIYSAFIPMTAWLLVGLVQRAWTPPRGRAARWIASVITAVVLTGAAFWAAASTSVYTRTHTRIEASRWIFENVPTAATVHLRTAEGEDQVQVVVPSGTIASEGAPVLSSFRVDAEADLSRVTLNRVTDPQGDPEPERVRIALATDGAGEAVIAETTELISPPVSQEPKQSVFPLSGVQLVPGQTYHLVTEPSGAAPVQLFSAVATLHLRTTDGETQLQPGEGGTLDLPVELPHGATYQSGAPVWTTFTVPQEGVLTRVTFDYVASFDAESDRVPFRMAVAPDPETILAETTAEIVSAVDRRAESFEFTLESVRLLPETTYYLVTEVVEGGSIQLFTSILATEHWDWAPPLRVDGHDPFGGMYRGLSSSGSGQLELYHADNLQKRADMLAWLDEADYIITGSNRLYASIPRLAPRYPLTMAYYEALFSGDLGFELVADFRSPLALGPFQFPDQEEPFPIPEAEYEYRPAPISVPMPPAEETFSVYDHPRVLIFRKTAAYSRVEAEALLPPSLLEDVVHVTAREPEADEVQNAQFDPEMWAEQRAGGTWSAMFNRQGMLNRFPGLGAAAWYLAAAVLGWLAFPLLFVALPRLRDRGYGLARPMGLLVVSYLTWLAASLHILPNTRWTIALMVVLLAAAGAAVGWRRRGAMRDFLRARWRTIAVEEGLFLLMFLVWIYVRTRNPDLWHPVVGGEKPMDFAYLNAVIKSTWFPPYDPWYAGGYLNYYYFGFVLFATLTKLLAIVPAIAYNLAIPLFYAMVGTATFSLGFNLFAGRGGEEDQRPGFVPYIAGAVAVVLVLILGNLGEVRLLFNGFRMLAGEQTIHSTIPGLPELVQALRGFVKAVQGQPLPFRMETPYWEPTRMVPFPAFIEFPAFTFLYGDPHAHMFAMPYTVTVLALTLNWARGGYRLREGWLLSGLMGALAIGSLWAANTWDYPGYLILGLAGLVLGIGVPTSGRRIFALVWRGALLVGVSILLFVPYTRNYVPAVSGLQMVPADQRISLTIYVLLIGQFLFPLGTLLVIDGWKALRKVGILIGAGALLAGLLVMKLGVPVGVLALPFGVTAAVLALTEKLPMERRVVWMILALAMAIALATEIVAVGGDRMNTVAKFHNQIWMLLAVGTTAALVWLAERSARWAAEWQQLWWIVMALVIFSMALFPIMAFPARLNDRITYATGPTLDGMAYMAYSQVGDVRGMVDLGPDHAAIVWLQENVEGSPVILEGLGEREYLWGSRVSIYTGLPTVIGWRWHQVQQRMATVGAGRVDDRRIDVQTAYSTSVPEEALGILERYDVRYIYVGPYERLYYDAQGLAKFDAMVADGDLELVYDRNGVKIYEVLP
jgi:YYY domain-containing protein